MLSQDKVVRPLAVLRKLLVVLNLLHLLTYRKSMLGISRKIHIADHITIC
jgi:hypothetical protein